VVGGNFLCCPTQARPRPMGWGGSFQGTAVPAFAIDGLSVGSGSASNQQTLKWLTAWKASGRPWPWYIKQSYATIRKLDGAVHSAKADL
jgi:hypothetical protein